MACFHIYAPFYQKNSNGVRILYTLFELIQKTGHTARVVCDQIGKGQFATRDLPSRYQPFTMSVEDMLRNKAGPADIVIYPDIVSANPLNAANAVRYLLNRPWYLTGEPVHYGDTDYLVAYSTSIDSHLPQLFLLNDDREYFFPSRIQKKTTWSVFITARGFRVSLQVASSKGSWRPLTKRPSLRGTFPPKERSWLVFSGAPSFS